MLSSIQSVARWCRTGCVLVALVLGPPAVPRAMAQAPTNEYVTANLPGLASEEPRQRVGSAYNLGNLAAGRNPQVLRALQAQAAGPLVHALSDGDPDVRAAAAFALGNVVGFSPEDIKAAELRLLPALVAALHDQAAPVRARAAAALAKYGAAGEPAVPGLVLALHDGEPGVREAAAEALGNIGAAPDLAVPALASAVKDAGERAGDEAAQSLAKFGPMAATAIPALTPLLGRPDLDSRYNAAVALSGMGSAAQPALLPALHDENGAVRLEAATAFAGPGPNQAEALAVATRELLDPDPDNRARAAGVIGSFGAQGTHALGDLGKALGDHDEDVRRVASIATGRIAGALKKAGRTDSIEDLKAVLAVMSASGDTSAQTSAPELAEAVSSLQEQRQRGLGYRLTWPLRKQPVVASIILGYALLAATWLVLLLAAPLFVLRAGEALSGLPKLRLPDWLGGVEVSPANLLLVGFLARSDRVLDAWVERAAGRLRASFAVGGAVGPVTLDGQVLPELTPAAVRQSFQGRAARLLVLGDPDWAERVIRTLARMAMARDPEERFRPKAMLPVQIDENLLPASDAGGDPLAEGLREFLPPEAGSPSDALISVLLRRQRILPIVMNFPARDEPTRAAITRFGRSDRAACALIVTSTGDETLGTMRFAVFKPGST